MDNLSIKIPKVGQIIKGEVIRVDENTIYLDLNTFTEGRIHLDNFDKDKHDSFIGLVRIGDIIEAKVQKVSYEEPPLILLSRLPLLKEEKFNEIIEAQQKDLTLKVLIKKVIDKGLLFECFGYEGFLPFTLLEHEFVNQKDELKNKTLEVKIIEASLNGRRHKIVASRKPIFELIRKEANEKRSEERKAELDAINTGDILEGTIEKIEPFAATVRFNNVAGLLRISQVCHFRIEKISEVLALGDKVKVKVIKKEGNRIDLSIKALQKTPYENYSNEYKTGSTVTGKVIQKLPFGLVVELSLGVRGLLHKNEFSWNPNDNYDTYVKIGDEISLSLLNIDSKRERVSLSRKALLDNPWKNVSIKRGDKVEAKVLEVTKNGLIVLADGVEGKIPVSELFSDRIGKPEEYFAVGDIVTAIVTEANRDTWELELSIKRVLILEERKEFAKYLESDKTEDKMTIGDLISEDLKKKKGE